MGRDEKDKSLLGRLSRLQEKLADDVERRREQIKQQERLNGSMNDMSLQPNDLSQRTPSRGSSQTRLDNEMSGKALQPPQEQPPVYQDPNPLPTLVPEKSSKAPMSQPPAAGSSSGPNGYFTTQFASLSLHMTDRIRVMDFPIELSDVIRQAILRSWTRGIQAECSYYGSYEFKLYGSPWYPSTYSGQSIDARRLMRHLFEVLYDAGWVLALSTDVSRKQADKDTLIFRHQTPAPARREWISIDFARGDRIRIIDAPQDLLDAIYQQLQPAIQSYVQQTFPGIWEIKLHGYPWSAVGGETMTARRTLLHLFAVLERFGYTVYASIDQESTYQDNRSETDSWHCCRPLGWTPGAPVYHA